MSFTLMKGTCILEFNCFSLFLVISHLLLSFRTMPLNLLLPKIDDLYQSVCLHCHFGELWQQQMLLSFQTLAAILFTIGYQTKIMAVISWYMYTSLILRNTWLYFILDRYFYYLLFYAMFLPLDERWSLSSHWSREKTPGRLIINPGTVRASWSKVNALPNMFCSC